MTNNAVSVTGASTASVPNRCSYCDGRGCQSCDWFGTRLSAIAPNGAASVELREAAKESADMLRNRAHYPGCDIYRLRVNGAAMDCSCGAERAAADLEAALASSSPVDGEKVRVGDEVIVWPGAGKGLDYRARVEWIDGDRASVRPLDVALSSPAWVGSKRARTVKLTSLSRAAPSHIGNGGEGGAVPAGMKRWHGGENAPEDWDGGAVLMRNGSFSIELSRGVAPDGKLKSGRWFWHKPPAFDDIIAYTPKTTTAGKSGEDAETYTAFEPYPGAFDSILGPEEAPPSQPADARLRALENAVKQARDKFAFCAVEHRKKAGNFAMSHGAHSPECFASQEKAQANDEMAAMMERALALGAGER